MENSAALTDVFQTAITEIQGDVLEFVQIALPVALAIVGLFVAVKLGIRFFKSVAK